MKQKLPRFSFKDNPANKDDFSDYIYSDRQGERVLCKVGSHEITDIMNLPEGNDVHNFLYTSRTTGMPEFFRITVIKNVDMKEEAMQSIFRDMAVWYEKQQKDLENYFFDNNTKTEKPTIKEYNDKVKGLSIIYSNKEDKWIYIYKAHARVFESDTQGDAWLSEKFNINKLHLKDGKLNISEDVDAYITRKLEEEFE